MVTGGKAHISTVNKDLLLINDVMYWTALETEKHAIKQPARLIH